MNRFNSPKFIISVVIILVLLVAGGFLWYVYIWQQKPIERSVTINLDPSVTSAKIVGDIWECGTNAECDPTLIEKSMEKSGTIQLKDGIYYVTPISDKVSDEAIKITVSSSETSFEIKPYFSETYLSSLLANELPSLHNVIRAAYPITAQYVIGNGRLYQFGEWYATTLTPQETVDNPHPDTHYIILHKTNNSWVVVGEPSLYFRYAEHQDIPRDIIESVNSGIEE